MRSFHSLSAADHRQLREKIATVLHDHRDWDASESVELVLAAARSLGVQLTADQAQRLIPRTAAEETLERR